jgi:NADPH:quinone reductase-like Zn-dependent oxidoreductase
MKAAVFQQFGTPEQIVQLAEVPTPEPGRGEVLVRMLASPINPSDLLYIEGRYGLKPKSFPAIPGFEGVGIVERSGGGLLGRLRVGKRVAVLNDSHGNWAGYTVTSARQVMPIPESVPTEQAASFFVNPLTAVVMTQHVLKLQAGDWLLQSAAGSALGQMIIRLSKVYGFKTINIVRRAEQVDELKQLGAQHVLVEGTAPLTEQLAALNLGGSIRHAIDPVGGATGTAVVSALAPGGHCLLYGLLSGEPVSVDPRLLITGSKTVQGFWLADWVKQQGTLKMLKLLRQVRSALVDGLLQTPIAATYPLADITRALHHAQQAGRTGKVLVQLG